MILKLAQKVRVLETKVAELEKQLGKYLPTEAVKDQEPKRGARRKRNQVDHKP